MNQEKTLKKEVADGQQKFEGNYLSTLASNISIKYNTYLEKQSSFITYFNLPQG